ncbi:MAG TPA: hypothetical protein VD767_08250, partial [Thermomicrobiales bacterium]|nr:hypothetical protein [Thermomicrobiales bacterium]
SMPDSLDQQYSTSPIRPRPGMAAMTTLVQDAATGRLSGFLNDVVNTARGWMDKSQATLPGYKERIVGIHLYKEQGEGGLNLNMEADTITRLANRGLYGMHRFLELWKPDLGSESEWHQHRWLRYVILMRSLENFGQEWNITFNGVPTAGDVHRPSIADLVATAPPASNGLVHAYPVTTDQRLLSNAFARYANATTRPAGTPFCNGLPCGEFDNLSGLEREPRHLMMPPFD